MDATRLWRLEGVVKNYAWGSQTAIPELLGVEPDGRPQAELWLGAHPSAPAMLVGDDDTRVPLDAWIARDPEAVLGREVAERFDGKLPFLLKVLAAEAPLSIQAHPNAAQARAGFAREDAAGIPLDAPERCYKDPNHKPELICALTPFRALNRFREPAEIEAGIAALGVAGLERVLAPLRASRDRRGLAAFFAAWMTLEERERESLVAEAVAAARPRAGEDPACAEILRLDRAYPGDPGVLAPLFLNLVELAPGEAIYLPAGELHSYLGGVGVELMASSDNVLRGGLTAKFVAVDELLQTLSFESGPANRVRPVALGPGAKAYPTGAEEFSLALVQTRPDTIAEPVAPAGPEILLCLDGSARVESVGRPALDLPRGASVFVPAASEPYRVIGAATVIRAACGQMRERPHFDGRSD